MQSYHVPAAVEIVNLVWSQHGIVSVSSLGSVWISRARRQAAIHICRCRNRESYTTRRNWWSHIGEKRIRCVVTIGGRAILGCRSEYVPRILVGGRSGKGRSAGIQSNSSQIAASTSDWDMLQQP